MATKNLKVLMSGDTKPYRAEIDQAAVATKVMKDEIGGQMNDLAGLFGANIATIGKSSEKISSVFQGLLSSLSSAAAGGTAFTVAQTKLASASTVVSQAEARVIVANEALTAAQASATISAEALLAAELEVAAAAKALASGQVSLAVAQKAVAVATDTGTIAMNIFKVAMISTGIGALIIALGAVVAYFTSTREGANKLKVIMAELGAMVTFLKDTFSTLGGQILGIGEKIWDFGEKTVAASNKSTGFLSKLKEALMAPIENSPLLSMISALYSKLTGTMADTAAVMGELEKRTQALTLEEINNIGIQQKRLTLASQLFEASKQEGVAASDKKKYITEARAQTEAYYAEEKKQAEEHRDIVIEQAKQHKNMTEELRAVAEAKAKVDAIDGELAESELRYDKAMKSVNKEIIAQAEAEAKSIQYKDIINEAINKETEALAIKKETYNNQLKLIEQGKVYGDQVVLKKELQEKLNQAEIESATIQQKYSESLNGTTEQIKAQATAIVAKWETQRKIDEAEAKKLGGVMTMRDGSKPLDNSLDLKGMAASNTMAANYRAQWKKTADSVKKSTIDISGSLSTSADDFGTFIGNLVNGQGGIQSFGDFVANSFANLSTDIGKQMIAIGTAGIALKVLFDDPFLAVAAGVALVALGTMAKNSISSSISNAGGSSAMSSGGGQNYNFDTRSSTSAASTQKINVVVSGQLTASGKALATTLNNENTRISMST